MSDEPVWRIRERLVSEAERAVEGRRSFEEHVRPSTKPLTMAVDPRDLLAVLREET